jgi:hypothetical protein
LLLSVYHDLENKRQPHQPLFFSTEKLFEKSRQGRNDNSPAIDGWE